MHPFQSEKTNVARSRAWYGDSIEQFLVTDPEKIVGALLANSEFAVLPTQKDAWIIQLSFLRNALEGRSGNILLEFSIPRLGRRIDAVLLIGPVIFAIEFKVGEATFGRAAIEQVWDYALDLKNFHEASHNASIVPVLIATEAVNHPKVRLIADLDGVFRPVFVGQTGLERVIDLAIEAITGEPLEALHWASAPYRPTPTIVEAARALYAHHSVEAIARFDAGAENLRVTSSRLDVLVDEAMIHRRKIICFVTGVPGAGKTLVGLNVATRHRRELEQPTHAVFLSGNGPLVAVLREALARDEVERRKSQGEKVRKSQVGESVKAFIQNVHHFRDEGLLDPRAPNEHVVIFDEAQRAWNLQQTANFMQRKKKRPGFNQSEPEFLISYMDRHTDWAVIICLVGGGQEINIGEAGIDTWLDAVRNHFPDWHMYVSSRLTDSEYAAATAQEIAVLSPNAHFDDNLHLSVSMRSFRAENVSFFVKALLDCDVEAARESYANLKGKFPILISRDLERAKEWIRSQARGSERFGLVASSKAQRLKPHAIDVRVDVDPVHWFLNDREDTRSSYYLEDAATEFQVQGLELDWTCVTWDGDLRFGGSEWSYHDFRGSRWTNISKPENRNYLRNAYRVLLTRARQGMVIFIPPGDPSDPTRSPAYYDPTFEYLVQIGMPVLT
ncbi:MAG: DUF2075 domain-containing protein [Verrucomicrobiales bacterium]|nr:DUF2075 domain-containing protein [Verrucomicrobiales bacterium]